MPTECIYVFFYEPKNKELLFYSITLIG